jgi:hypothetical protein
MLAIASKFRVRRRRPDAAFARLPTIISCKIVQWRAMADEYGHYCFAIAL